MYRFIAVSMLSLLLPYGARAEIAYDLTLKLPVSIECNVMSNDVAAKVDAQLALDGRSYLVRISGQHFARSGPKMGQTEEISINEYFTIEDVEDGAMILTYSRGRRTIYIEVPLLGPEESIIDDRLVFFADHLACNIP
jgi:hypothetical protein